MSIHPLALVSPEAQIGPGTEIGPFCVVEPNVSIGPNCRLHSHVVIRNGTSLGANNQIFEGAVLGGPPQHVHMPENPGTVIIGSNNTIRENVTVHRALATDAATIIGDDNLLMNNTHVAHDCRVGNRVVLVANVMLAGHVTVGDRANISGAVAVHQFCRIGTMAMVGGQAHLTKDVPPFVTVDGLSSLVVGLNQIGLRRNGFNLDVVSRLKAAYRVIYRSGLPWKEILDRLQAEFHDGLAGEFHAFLSTTKRGIINERRMPPNATIKLRENATEVAAKGEQELRIACG